MSSKAAAILLGLLVLACGPSRQGLPLLGDFEVRIGSPPVMLLEQAQPLPRGNARRERRMLELFSEVGCPQLERRRQLRTGRPQVICTLPGQSASTILVSANFDQPPSRQHSDNWVGAAMLPSLYASLAVVPRFHTYTFVAFLDQGPGYLANPAAWWRMGQRLRPAERERVVAQVNLQGLGLDVSAVWEPVADPDLRVDLYSVSLSLQLPLRRIDLTRERRRPPASGVPSILIGVADRQIGEYLDSFRLVAVFLSYLDQTCELRRQLREGKETTGTFSSAAEPSG